MNEKITLEINTEFEGNALDFAVTPGPVGTLTAAEAEEIARNLLAASALAAEAPDDLRRLR